MPDPSEVILEEARRKLERQSDRFDDLRTRSVALLGSAAVVTGLFGFRLGGHHTGARLGLLIAALVAFSAIVGLTIAINWPVDTDTKGKRWADGTRLDRWFDPIKRGDPSVETFGVYLAEQLYRARNWNESIVSSRMGLFRWMCAAIGIEVLCWSIAVGL